MAADPGCRPPWPARIRLDAELVRRGLARSREQAAELISGGRVAVAGLTAGKPATQVGRDAAITVSGGAGPRVRVAGRPQAGRGPGRVRRA